MSIVLTWLIFFFPMELFHLFLSHDNVYNIIVLSFDIFLINITRYTIQKSAITYLFHLDTLWSMFCQNQLEYVIFLLIQKLFYQLSLVH